MEIRTTLIKKKKRQQLKHTIKEKLSTHSILYRMVQRTFGFYRYFRWKAISQYHKAENNIVFDSTYFVKPDDIFLCTEKELEIECDGMRLDGNWDISSKKFKNLDVYIAFTDHFFKNIEWENTQYYKNILNIIHEGFDPWGCANEIDLKQRCNSLDLLYLQIKTEGYKKQTELAHSKYDIRKFDEISVNLDRNGNLLFNDGAHRLSIAKILGIETIPVRVNVCHTKCRNFEKLHLTEND